MDKQTFYTDEGPIEIRYVNKAIANHFGDHIELNKNLKKHKYNKLHRAIISHELRHSSKQKNTWRDIKNDFFSSGGIDSFQLIKFMIQNPRSFSQWLPIYYSKEKGIVIDINLILLEVVSISVFSGILWLLLS